MTHPLILEARRISMERSRRAAAYSGPPLPFTHLGNNREADMPWLSHEEAAGAVRMLMREQFDHEAICCMARDRILHLAQENERLRTALQANRDDKAVPPWIQTLAHDTLGAATRVAASGEIKIPAGYALVPIQPTQRMMDAGLYQASADAAWEDVYSMWVDMVSVAEAPVLTGDAQ